MDTDPRKEVGERIRRARKGAGLTQTDLAVIIGTDQTTVSVWETGKTKQPPSAMLAMIEKACGVDAGALSAGLDLPDPTPKVLSFEERLTATTAEVVALREELREVSQLVAELQTALSGLVAPGRRGRPPRP